MSAAEFFASQFVSPDASRPPRARGVSALWRIGHMLVAATAPRSRVFGAAALAFFLAKGLLWLAVAWGVLRLAG
jgi:hypothetical protein